MKIYIDSDYKCHVSNLESGLNKGEVINYGRMFYTKKK